jgi:Putative phage serine protease XkdF
VMKRGATGKTAGAVAAARVVKAEAERRYTLCLVYPAERPDVSVAMDGYRDFATCGAVQDAAWSYLRKGGQVGLMHAQGTAGSGDVVESYLWPGDDWVMRAADGSRQVIRKGDWLAGIVWSRKAWDLIKSGRVTGVSMQGTAVRRRPTRDELASLRKASDKGQKRLARAVREAAAEAFADPAVKARLDLIRDTIGGTEQRMRAVEKARGLRCAKCGTLATGRSPRFCHECGAALGGAAVKAAGTPADAARVGAVITKAKRDDPAALLQLVRAFGPLVTARLIDGSATLRDVGGSLAKAAEALDGDKAEDSAPKCRTCGGKKRLRHPATGKPSRNCPSCGGTGKWVPDGDNSDMTPEDAGLVRQYAQAAKAGSAEAFAYLAHMVGPDMASAILTGAQVTPGQFQRAYISAARAAQCAAPGQEPRIPQATHVALASDFRRGPLGAGQSQAAPASAWPGDGGQMDYYEPGPGIPAHGTGVPTTWPALAASHTL